MCLAVAQNFNGCNCSIIRYLICEDHVNHTRKQIDNKPCSKAKSRFVEMERGGCGFGSACEERETEVWVFDHFTPDQADFTFLELPGKALSTSARPKCLEKGHFTKHHDCGIGKAVNVPWRHVDEYGNLFGEVTEGVKKEEKEGVKMEEEDQGMEGIPTNEDIDVEMANLEIKQ
ncbi:hypothetical protein BGZ57DRAFT_1002253 [Hyaloscypha finlandica]|nr:hypothetical protein BGZ57DRAFT_1002253 [Hyaloscypha finlandica]KAH8793542.1 hypothetical protein F5882DRAFT_376174 [Hyaloscypha sp. PMI_1271]